MKLILAVLLSVAACWSQGGTNDILRTTADVDAIYRTAEPTGCRFDLMGTVVNADGESGGIILVDNSLVMLRMTGAAKLTEEAAGWPAHAPAKLREDDLLIYKAPAYDGSGDISATLRHLLEKGYCVALGLRQYDEAGHELLSGGHMVSLWGLEYDDAKGAVTRLYLTDSDDVVGTWPQHQKGLFAAECTPVADLRYSGSKPFPGLTLANRLGWFRPRTTITTIVALHADAGMPPAPAKN